MFLVTGGDAAGIGGLNVANVLAFIIVARWIHPFGFVASLAFGLVFAYLTIITGRWLFGRKAL